MQKRDLLIVTQKLNSIYFQKLLFLLNFSKIALEITMPNLLHWLSESTLYNMLDLDVL